MGLVRGGIDFLPYNVGCSLLLAKMEEIVKVARRRLRFRRFQDLDGLFVGPTPNRILGLLSDFRLELLGAVTLQIFRK